nr:ParB/RepB/Spo0J family partition protein [Motilibacter deserti]
MRDIAENPDNPRSTLGDLAELADSIRESGVQQPATLVPAAAWVASHPDHAAAVAGRSYVVVMGHRRRAASELAQRDTLPAIVREDLADPVEALVAAGLENLHREDLTPLDEARQYAALAERKVSQRDIARRLGVAQSQVSKRLALLRLAPDAQRDLADGALSLADAAALAALPDAQAEAAYALAKERSLPVASAAQELTRRAEAERAVARAQEQAAREAVPLVDPAAEWDADEAEARRLHAEDEVAAARAEGALVAVATPQGLDYYTTVAPAAGGDARPASAADDERERRRAAKARAAACAALVQAPPDARAMLRELADATLRRRADSAGALKLVHGWLGRTIGDTYAKDPEVWRDSLAAGPDRQHAWAAWAMTVAADELSARAPRGDWGPRQAMHLQRLMDSAGYAPTAWELRRLEAARTPDAGSPDANSPDAGSHYAGDSGGINVETAAGDIP